jgi:hypothetical protein
MPPAAFLCRRASLSGSLRAGNFAVAGIPNYLQVVENNSGRRQAVDQGRFASPSLIAKALCARKGSGRTRTRRILLSPIPYSVSSYPAGVIAGERSVP